ncbi:MAG: hypothetical protein QNJ51_06470 [Calothrix sp. MO_167.B12]|nr:hypothetical protein [Calothrix sp. MO_167.B12]
MFTHIHFHKPNGNHGAKPTQQDGQQILDILENAQWHERVPLKEEDCQNIQFDKNDLCHAASRKVASANSHRGWVRVSGYLVLREKIDNHANILTLKHHSVVKDEDNNLIETVEIYYPIKKYLFICHPSGIKGWEAQVS